MAKKKLLSGNGWSFEPADSAVREETESLPDDRQKVKISLEKRAKGKEATVVRGFVLTAADRKALAQTLRKSCGAGGSDSDGVIEVQGDHREKVRTFLTGKGWKTS